MNTLKRSNIRWELTERRITRKIKLVVLIGLIVATAWMADMIWALGVLQTRPIIHI